MPIKLSFGRSLVLGLAAAGLTLPSAAFAVGERTARATISEAKGKIEAGDKAGVGGEAADIQARARAALEVAEKAIRKDEENNALRAAEEADALAGLAQATAELRRLTAERDQLAAAGR